MIDVEIHWGYMVPPGITIIIAGWIFGQAEALGAKNISIKTLRTGWLCAGFTLGWIGVILIKHGSENNDNYAIAVGIGLILGSLALTAGGIFHRKEKLLKRSKREYISLHDALNKRRIKNKIPPSERVDIAQKDDGEST